MRVQRLLGRNVPELDVHARSEVLQRVRVPVDFSGFAVIVGCI